MTVTVSLNRAPSAGGPMIMACFSYRHDAHLVPALLENIAPIVHGWAAFDDRKAQPWYSSEVARRQALLSATIAHGAQWLLVVDPDERFEDAFAQRIGELTRAKDKFVWTVNMHEMFAPMRYRVDGIWGGRLRQRLFPIFDDIRVPTKALHAHPFEYSRPRPVRASGMACYHLRMMTPARRQLRRDQYALLDPERALQEIGYDYLAMEAGAEFATIAPGREFSPPHVEDNGLWAPALPAGSLPLSDPLRCRLKLIERSTNASGRHFADNVATKITQDFAEDCDLALLAAGAALMAGQPAKAVAGLKTVVAQKSSGAADILLARAHMAIGATAPAIAAVCRALEQAPVSRIALKAFQDVTGGPWAYGSKDALWRRWVRGTARIAEGAYVPTSAPICVIIIGFRGQPELEGAVRSVIDQSPQPEVVVVNSGGGGLGRLLDPWRDRLRLIELDEPHFVGAARNVGIDASRARIVSFLAGDCLATPGWITDRLRAHQSGQVAVPSAILPTNPGNLVSWIASALQHHGRWPDLGQMASPGYGLSYERGLFNQLGYFPTGMGGAEDTYLNNRIYERFGYDLTPIVCTLHRYPETVHALISDTRRRGNRRMQWDTAWRKRAANDPAMHLASQWQSDLSIIRRRLASALGSSATDITANRLLALGMRGRIVGTKAGIKLLKSARDALREHGQVNSDENARAAISLDPFHASHYLNLAQRHAARQDWAEAISIAGQGLALEPENVDLVKILCRCTADSGDLNGAIDLAEEAAMMCPTLASLWMLAAEMALAGGDSRRAQVSAQFAFLTAPAQPEPNALLAKIYRMTGDEEAANRRDALVSAMAKSLA